jgi:TPR repeat protein
LFQDAALRGDADAQYGLAVLYKEGRGVPKSSSDAALWMGRAALSKNVAAETEYGIMLFNGEGVAKNEQAAAAMFRRAAEKNGAVAQNRLARLYFAGRGVRRDLVEGAKWAILSNAQGLKDPWLDDAMRELTPGERRQAEEAVQRFLSP